MGRPAENLRRSGGNCSRTAGWPMESSLYSNTGTPPMFGNGWAILNAEFTFALAKNLVISRCYYPAGPALFQKSSARTMNGVLRSPRKRLHAMPGVHRDHEPSSFHGSLRQSPLTPFPRRMSGVTSAAARFTGRIHGLLRIGTKEQSTGGPNCDSARGSEAEKKRAGLTSGPHREQSAWESSRSLRWLQTPVI